MDSSNVYTLERETLEAISQVANSLADYCRRLVDRRDLDAYKELAPMAKRLSSILVAIVIRDDPDFERVIDSIEDAYDKTRRELTPDKSPEELNRILRDMDEFTAKIGEIAKSRHKK